MANLNPKQLEWQHRFDEVNKNFQENVRKLHGCLQDLVNDKEITPDGFTEHDTAILADASNRIVQYLKTMKDLVSDKFNH